MTERLALRELKRTDWSTVHVMAGPATAVPGVIEKLLAATTAEEANQLYWKLENSVVVQYGLFDSAVPLVSVLLAAIIEPLADPVRTSVLELLFQIAMGEGELDEYGNSELGNLCRERAREGLWLLYGQLASRDREVIIEILEVIEPDKERLRSLTEAD